MDQRTWILKSPQLILHNCRFASDVTAAMLGVKNKSVSLRWEMNSILIQILPKNFFCIDHQHGRLVTWLQTKNSLLFSVTGQNTRNIYTLLHCTATKFAVPERQQLNPGQHFADLDFHHHLMNLRSQSWFTLNGRPMKTRLALLL